MLGIGGVVYPAVEMNARRDMLVTRYTSLSTGTNYIKDTISIHDRAKRNTQHPSQLWSWALCWAKPMCFAWV
jgi:hypothetical protein